MNESLDLTVIFHDILKDELARGMTKDKAVITAGKAIGLIR